MNDLILILDDEINYATMVSDLLEANGYRTEVSTRPQEALERLHQHSYGLIITDFKMPELDGAELLSAVRKVLPTIPVIMISGLMGKAELLRVANIGVTLVLEKPFNVPTFLEEVARFVRPSTSSDPCENLVTEEASGSEDDGPSYPQPLTHLVDESRAMKQFLNRLWSNLENYAHIPIVIPEGGEFEAIVRQAGQWIGAPDADPKRITLPELDRNDVRARLEAQAAVEASSSLVAITVPDHVEVDLARLARFFHWAQSCPSVAAHLRFILALPDVLEARQFAPSGEIEKTVAPPLALPPLRERLVDLGAWVDRTIRASGPEHLGPFSPPAIDLLLQYPWKSNHRDLLGTVRRAIALARRREVSAGSLRLAMKLLHLEPPPAEDVQGIASYLQVEQGRFLDQYLPQNDRFEALSKMVGGKMDRICSDREINDQPLLFEELAEIPGTA